MAEKRVLVTIEGEVQGVGYRAACRREAARLGVRGWVRNRMDGAVEAQFEGEARSVDALVAWCRHGPPAAEVHAVRVTEAAGAPPQASFTIRG